MKKIIYGLLAALFLIGCQQPTIDPSRPETEVEQEVIEEEIVEEEVEVEDALEQEEVEDEHKAIIEEYRAIFNEYKADLESKKEPFEAFYCYSCDGVIIDKSECKYCDWSSEPFWSHRDEDGDFHSNVKTTIEYLDYLDNDYSHLLNYYEVEQPHSYHTRWNFSSAEMADAIRPFVESIKKDLEEVKAQYAEISSLLTEVNEVLNELDSMYIERIVANKIELEDKIEKLQTLDVHILIVMYDDFEGPIHSYNPRDKDLYTHYDLYKRVFNENN